MFSHNVTFYEKIQIWLSSTKFSYCRSIILNLIQTFLRTCGEVLIEKYFEVFGSSQNSWWKTSWKLGNLCLLLIESIKQPFLLNNLKSILGLSTLALWYVIGNCRNEETIDNENAFNLEEKHYDIPAMYSLLKLVNKSINIIMAFFMLALVLRMTSDMPEDGCNDPRRCLGPLQPSSGM
jgi:hypothetical protein